MCIRDRHYIAPEQAKGLNADARSDLYSLGVVLYEMTTGHLPYDADTPEEIALKHIAGSAKPPREWNSDIPEELERITLKAMEPDPVSYTHLDSREIGMLIDATYGRKTQAVLIMDTGHAVLSALLPDAVQARVEATDTETGGDMI